MDKLYPISLVNLVIDGIHYGHERNLIINIIYPKDHISTSVDTLKFAFDIAKKYLNTNEQVPTEYRTDIKISYTPLNGEVWNSEEKYVIDLRSVDIIDTDDIACIKAVICIE